MLKGVSDDINEVIDWELAHGNEMSNIPPREVDGYLVIGMAHPLRTSYDGKPRVLPPSLRLWEWRSQHYAEYQWLDGFKSDLSGQVVCGPIREYSADELRDNPPFQ